MQRILIALLSLLFVASAHAQTGSIKTQTQLNTEVGSPSCTQPTCLFPDNSNGQITPNDLRQFDLDIVATIYGMSGSCTVSGAFVITCSGSSGANPTASVGISAVNGAALSFMRSDAAPPINQAMAPTWSGVHKWTNDALFGNGRPWCDVREQGAVGDSSTSDLAAFNLCSTALHVFGGGIIFVPPANGNYCLYDGSGNGFVTTSGDTVQIVMAGRQVSLSDCNHDVITVSLQGPNSGISNGSVKGRGADTGDTFAINNPTIKMLSSCTNCVLQHLHISGGTIPISVVGGGQWLIYDVVATQAYGAANINVVAASNGGISSGWIWRSFSDDSFPTGTGPTGTAGSYTIAAWSAGHAFAANAVITNSGYYLQCMNCDGVKTTAGIAPTNPVYGVSVVDNQVSWQLVSQVNSCNITLDSGSTQTRIFETDATGPHTHNICVTNSRGWSPAGSLNSIVDSSPAAALSDNVFVDAGTAISIIGNNPINFCYASGCSGIQFTSNFGGGLTVANNLMYAGTSGVVLNTNASAGKINADVSHNRLFGYSTGAIIVQSSITDFIIDGNVCGSSGIYGTNNQCYTTNTGDDYEIITNNDTHGATNASSPANGAGSAHSTVTGNL